jgi:hypothetical protein
VVRDRTPPRVAIALPADKSLITGNTTTVTGSVHDLVIGTVGRGDCVVMVNGVTAEVENGSFRADDVPVAEGAGTITTVATDVAGNTASAVIEVTGNLASNAMIFMVSGDGQAGVVQNPLSQPLVARTLDNTGQPVAGMPVTFRVTRSNGRLGNGGREETLLSDALGRASTTLRLGTSAGAASDQVTATAPGFLGTATFVADGVPDPVLDPTDERVLRVLTVASGANQKGIPNALAPLPLAVFLSDGNGNPVASQEVTFTVRQGGGRVDGASSVTKWTDFDGRAFALLTMGSGAGGDSQLVEATVAGTNTAQFVGSVLEVGNPASTRVTGLVLTNENNPIENALVSIEGTAVQGVTNAEGRFELTLPLPAGTSGYKRVHLDVIGAQGGPYPSELEFEMDLIPGAENTMDRPVYLPVVDVDGVGVANETTDLVLRRTDTPGFVLTIPAGSTTFTSEEGCTSDAQCTGEATCVGTHCQSRTGNVQVITVHNDKIPMLPSDGALPTLTFAIMPHTARFDPPAPIRMPNVDGREAGEVLQLYSYDHDLGMFVVVGTATVSEDGQEIVSEHGQGIIKGGWHYIPPGPTPPTCLSDLCYFKVCTNCGNNPNCSSTGQPQAPLCWKCRGINGTGGATNCGTNPDPTISPQDSDYSPDVKCYSYGSTLQTCPTGTSCPAPARRENLSCRRGYDPIYNLSMVDGHCRDPINEPTNALVCCPDANWCQNICCNTACQQGVCL